MQSPPSLGADLPTRSFERIDDGDDGLFYAPPP